MFWVRVHEWDLAICVPTKCGNRSMLLTIANHFDPERTYQNTRPSDYITQKNKHYEYMFARQARFHPEWTKLAIVRDPVDRFSSLWSHHCRDNIPGLPRDMRDRVVSMHELMNRMENNPTENVHWASQMHIIGKQENIEYCLIENAADRFYELTGVEMKHVNKTQDKEPVPDDIVDRLKKVWEWDFRMMEWVT